MEQQQQQIRRRSRRTVAAIWSGTLGAVASCLGKFAFGPSVPVWYQNTIMVLRGEEEGFNSRIQQQDEDPIQMTTTMILNILLQQVLPRGMFLVGMVTANALMLGSFVEGLETSGSVAATGLATASNFVVSSLLGWFFFDEVALHNPTWCLGFGMVLAGVGLLASVQVIVEDNGNVANVVAPRQQMDDNDIDILDKYKTE